MHCFKSQNIVAKQGCLRPEASLNIQPNGDGIPCKYIYNCLYRGSDLVLYCSRDSPNAWMTRICMNEFRHDGRTEFVGQRKDHDHFLVRIHLQSPHELLHFHHALKLPWRRGQLDRRHCLVDHLFIAPGMQNFYDPIYCQLERPQSRARIGK